MSSLPSSSKLLFILIALITFTIAACSDSDSSTETSATTDGANATADGATAAGGTPFANARFSANSLTNVVTIQFTPTTAATASKAQRNKTSFATVHWGDNTTDRLSSADSSASHVYLIAGVYAVRIVLDSGEIIRLGDVTIQENCFGATIRNRTLSGC